jgi:predicted outer membrane repeat protein
MMPSPRRLLLALLVVPVAARATVVTTATDEDDGLLGGGTGVSLREAVKYSAAGDTVSFAPALSGAVIRLTAGELTVSSALTIDGSTLPKSVILSGDKTGNGRTSDDTRIFRITNGEFILDSLILDRGFNQYGGAIYVTNTTTRLTLRNCVLSDNESITHGGAIYFIGALNSPTSYLRVQNCRFSGNDTGHDGGAIHGSGTLQIENSIFSDNTAFQGCAIFNGAGTTTVESCSLSGGVAYNGGAICNLGTFNLRGSTVSGNSAQKGGGIHSSSGTFVIENSTVSGNSSSSTGGGIQASGVLNLTNVTVAGNTAVTFGGGVYCDIVTATLVSTTVSANSALSTDGGIYNNESSPLTLANSIVAGNTAPSAPNLSGKFTGSPNLVSGEPLLAPLGDYGGPTQTMPPLPGSPAYKAAIAPVPATDQRGFPRVEFPELGAAEYQGTADAARYWHLDFDNDGAPFGIEQSLGRDPFKPDPAHPKNFSGPVINAAGQAVVRFGLNNTSTRASGTRWIVKRSPDLSPGSFIEIYRTTGIADSAAPGITFVRTSTDVTVTDTNPPPGGAFYRFEAGLEP